MSTQRLWNRDYKQQVCGPEGYTVKKKKKKMFDIVPTSVVCHVLKFGQVLIITECVAGFRRKPTAASFGFLLIVSLKRKKTQM